MNRSFAEAISDHATSLKIDTKAMALNQLKSITQDLEKDGIIKVKYDDDGMPIDMSFTEEGKAYMEVLAFNLSHRLKQELDKSGSILELGSEEDLKGIIAVLEGIGKNGLDLP